MATRRCWVWASFVLALGVGVSAAADSPVLYLTSQPLSLEDTMPGVGPREIVRQAILMAAHEAGWTTRDATLRESPAESERGAAVQLDVVLRGEEKSCTVELKQADDVLWTKTYPVARLKDYYPTFVRAVAEDCEQSFPEVLAKLGKSGAREGDEPEQLPEDITDMHLLRQLVHVRTLHRAGSEPTPEKLAALSRGYARLTLLTHHHWFGSSSVFLARALLYADRAVQHASTEGARTESRFSRAFVHAVVGRHGDALREWKELPGDQQPGYAALIEPAAKMDRKALAELAEDESWASLAALVEFYAAVSHQGRATMYETAELCSEAAPFAMGVYAEFTKNRQPFDMRRWAASTGPAALDASLDDTWDEAEPLPKSIRERFDALDEGDEAALHHRAGQLALMLIEEAEADGRADLSWQVVGRLLQEEIFVSMVGFIDDARNATKSDLSPYTNAAVEVLSGHPYVEYIRAWGFNLETERDEFVESIESLTLIDPRPHMHQLLMTLWNMKTEKYPAFGAIAARLAYADHIEHALTERARHFRGNAEFAKNYVRFFTTISPHSPSLLRMQIFATPEPSADDIAQWEQLAGEDEEVWALIYEHIKKAGTTADQIRVLKKRQELSPSGAVAVELANHYLRNREHDEFLATLKDYLEGKAPTLENAGVANALAQRLMSLKKWEEAAPYALMAAQTYSAWGLQTGSRYFEGVGDYEQSELLIRELTGSYGGISRMHWYMWCQRNGRGDLEASRPMAQAYFESDLAKQWVTAVEAKSVFYQLEGELQAALDTMKEANKMEPSYWNEMQIALLAHELGDDESRLWALAALKVRSRGRPTDKILAELVDLVHLDPTKEPSFQEVDKYLVPDNWDVHCDAAYFAAECARLLGKTERAQRYYEVALDSEIERRAPTLAGVRLRAMREP